MALNHRRICLCVAALTLFCTWGCERGKSAPANASSSAAQPAQNSSAPQMQVSEPKGPALRLNAERAMQYVKDIVTIGPRWPGSKGQEKTAAYLRAKLKNDSLIEDAFEGDTPAGKLAMRNFIARFPGTKDGIIVLAAHIDTPYPLRNTSFAGANDGASSTGLLLAIADQLRGKKLEGYSVWLAFLDGEEAVQQWAANDSDYGSRHLAAKWQQDGTTGKIKAFILADMIGDADLDILRDDNSTPWLEDMVFEAAKRLGYQSHFFAREAGMDDDHTPFARSGVPVADVIDFNYGYNNSYWHTTQDTIDKLSPRSLQITGDVILETLRLLNANADKLPAPAQGPRVPS